MDNNFQDRIDEYLLHGDAMSEEAKAQFLKEIEEDAEKKEQYEFTKSVKQAVTSRGEKLKAMAEFQKEMKRGNRNVWLWVSSVAAVLVVGFFTVNSLFEANSSTEMCVVAKTMCLKRRLHPWIATVTTRRQQTP